MLAGEHGGAQRQEPIDQICWGHDALHGGAGGGGGRNNGGGGGGGASSFKNTIAGTDRTVDATTQLPVNVDDPHYISSGSGSGGACQTNGVKGRVVLIIGDEATTFDSSGSDQTFVVQ